MCLACGLCCNGVIFGDLKLQAGDVAARLRSLDVPVSAGKFLQPCPAWQKCQCRIYSDRPAHCQHFECLLLKDLKSEQVSLAEALLIVRRAQRKISKVECLLRDLGEVEGGLDLHARFRRLTARVEASPLKKQQAVVYGRLTVAFHKLDQMLRASFYRSDY